MPDDPYTKVDRDYSDLDDDDLDAPPAVPFQESNLRGSPRVAPRRMVRTSGPSPGGVGYDPAAADAAALWGNPLPSRPSSAIRSGVSPMQDGRTTIVAAALRTAEIATAARAETAANRRSSSFRVKSRWSISECFTSSYEEGAQRDTIRERPRSHVLSTLLR
jgi:hypothetical protein